MFLVLGAFVPLTMAEAQGQDSVLSLFLFTVSFVCLVRDKALLAGAVLGLILYKPQLALPAILILAIASKKRARILLGFGIACLGLALLSFAIVGWKTAVAYPQLLAGFKPVNSADLHSVYGVMRGIFGGSHGDRYAVLAAGVFSVAVAASTAWLLYVRQAATMLTYGLLVTATLLMAYHVYLHDMTLLLIPLLAIANWLNGSGVRDRERYLLAACVVILYTLPMMYWNPRLYVCALLLFFAAFLWEACDGRQILLRRREIGSAISS